MGLAGFILFTGAFSSQNTGTTEDTSAFFVGCLIVAVIVGLIGAAMVWPLTTTSRALGLSPLESRRSVGNARRRRPTAPMVVTKPALDAAGDDEQSARPASPPASPQPTNEPVAIVAFLLGLLSFLLLPLGAVAVAAIACGLVALRRASRNGTSSGFALAGAVLGSISLATVVFLLATGLYDDVVYGDDPDYVGVVVVGRCFDSEDTEVAGCDVLHDAEVFGVVVHDAVAGVTYPGEAALAAYAQPSCEAALVDYVGAAFDRSDIEITTIPPTTGEWRRGNRQIACVATGHRRVGSLGRNRR